ncbi:MAG: hypothetical protein XD36_0451 [Halomonas sp. 54_146]|nr:MAG: hypothetical protein XD36_0451 [Halomonas sp. 54_146]
MLMGTPLMVGSSPLVRGSAGQPSPAREARRFIPARAGIGQPRWHTAGEHAVHPRSCGDRSIRSENSAFRIGSSPLVRGSAQERWLAVARGRFIPARAGIGSIRSSPAATTTVHPRSCGDRACKPTVSCGSCGSSPLVRGSVLMNASDRAIKRFIPARAGIGY